MKRLLFMLILALSLCCSSITSNIAYAVEDDYYEEDEEELELQKEIDEVENYKASISKIKCDTQRISLKIKKKSDFNYEVQYSKYKSFKKKVTKVRVRKPKYLSAKLSTATYYVRVRAYKRIDGTTYFGKFSKAKKIKIVQP